MAGIYGFSREAVRVKVKVITAIFLAQYFVSRFSSGYIAIVFFVTLNKCDFRNVKGHYHLNGESLALIHKLLR